MILVGQAETGVEAKMNLYSKRFRTNKQCVIILIHTVVVVAGTEGAVVKADDACGTGWSRS